MPIELLPCFLPCTCSQQSHSFWPAPYPLHPVFAEWEKHRPPKPKVPGSSPPPRRVAFKHSRAFFYYASQILANTISWPVGLMDKASASGAGDSRFESWAGQKHAYLCPLSFRPLFLIAHGYSMAIASGQFHILFGPFLPHGKSTRLRSRRFQVRVPRRVAFKHCRALFYNAPQTLENTVSWPVGLMDKASASGAGDSRFESWAGHFVTMACLQSCASRAFCLKLCTCFLSCSLICWLARLC